MRVLAVNIHQPFARFTQLRQRCGMAVDESARAATAIDHAPHEADAFITPQIVFSEPRLQGVELGEIELGGNFGALAAGADYTGLAPIAQHQSQGVDQNRLARASLAGEHGETRLEFEFDAIDDDEVFDGEMEQQVCLFRFGRGMPRPYKMVFPDA